MRLRRGLDFKHRLVLLLESDLRDVLQNFLAGRILQLLLNLRLESDMFVLFCYLLTFDIWHFIWPSVQYFVDFVHMHWVEN